MRVIVDCDYCRYRIQPHHLFRREGKVFYHAICWELLLLNVEQDGPLSKQAYAAQEILQMVNGGSDATRQ